MGTLPHQTMVNSVAHNAARITVIASSSTWMEGEALEQLNRVAAMPGMLAAAGMPDLHPGRGYPVGAAFLSTDRIYPALVGNDIGCGMSLWQTDLPRARWSAQKLAAKLGSIDAPLPPEHTDEVVSTLPDSIAHRDGLGTIGGGNHFAEVQQLDTLYLSPSEARNKLPWLDPSALQILVHSGSRGWGQAILQGHVRAHGHQGLAQGTLQALHYLKAHDDAVQYARHNRRLIAQRMARRWKADMVQVVDLNHNFVESLPGQLASQGDIPAGWLHRKGATPMTGGLVVIPGSRGDHSHLVEPLPDAPMAAQALWTLAHGAGRKWARCDCEARLSPKLRIDDLERTALGSLVICHNKSLMFEEAPQAYKSIEQVITDLEEAGLIRRVARFRPVLTYKTTGQSHHREEEQR